MQNPNKQAIEDLRSRVQNYDVQIHAIKLNGENNESGIKTLENKFN